MKKILNKMFLLLVLLMVISVPLLSVSAATSTKEGYLDDVKVRGTVTIQADKATASTTFGKANTASSAIVNLSYTYTNTKTGVNTTISAGNMGQIAASTSRSNPDTKKYRSWRANSTHKVTYSGQTWNASQHVYY